jgi:hypothetical protein
MFARVELVPTAAERDERYFEGIYEGGNLYDADYVHADVPNPDQTTTARDSDTEGPISDRSDMDCSDMEGTSGSRRRVRFVLPRQPRAGGDSDEAMEGFLTQEEAMEGFLRYVQIFLSPYFI